jgi:hypothetical protein
MARLVGVAKPGELAVMCPRSEARSVRVPICRLPVAVSTIARLPDLVAPAVTHHRPPAIWNRRLALGLSWNCLA